MVNRSVARALDVWMNGELVGVWHPARSGVSVFQYSPEWLDSPRTRALSLSLPVLPGNEAHRGEHVDNWFDNLLPDSKPIRESIAVVVKEKEGEVITLPKGQLDQNADEARIDGALAEDGNFSGTVENTRTGDLAVAIRTAFSTPLDSMKRKAIGQILASEYFARPETDSLVAFDGKDFHAEAKVRFKVTKAKMLTRVGGVALLENPIRPVSFMPSLADNIDDKKERKLPYSAKTLLGPSTERIIARITMPAGWTATLPANVKLDGPVGYYEMKYSQNGQELRIERTLRGYDVVLPPTAKAAIVDWLRKAGSEDGKMIVLNAPVHSVASR
jgi:HipA-like protein